MAFRADEAARAGFEELLLYFGRPQGVSEEERERSRFALSELRDECGPVVDGYPSWHPLVRNHNPFSPETRPSDRCGYRGLDHTRLFAHGFITCPYGDGQDVLDSVDKLPQHALATITARRLDVQLYAPGTTPILVKCEWHRPLEIGDTIPASIAMGLLLEQELACWADASLAETWESMRPYFLGRPHGSRSSLFLSQEAGQAMKRAWQGIIQTGMFGPIRV